MPGDQLLFNWQVLAAEAFKWDRNRVSITGKTS